LRYLYELHVLSYALLPLICLYCPCEELSPVDAEAASLVVVVDLELAVEEAVLEVVLEIAEVGPEIAVEEVGLEIAVGVDPGIVEVVLGIVEVVLGIAVVVLGIVLVEGAVLGIAVADPGLVDTAVG